MGLTADEINASASLQAGFQAGLAEVLGIDVAAVGLPAASTDSQGVTVSIMATSGADATQVQSTVIASLMTGSLTKDITAAAVTQGYQGDLSSFQVHKREIYKNESTYGHCFI